MVALIYLDNERSGWLVKKKRMYRRIHNAATYSITINWVNMMDGCLPLAHHISKEKRQWCLSQPGDLNLRQLSHKTIWILTWSIVWDRPIPQLWNNITYYDLYHAILSPLLPVFTETMLKNVSLEVIQTHSSVQVVYLYHSSGCCYCYYYPTTSLTTTTTTRTDHVWRCCLFCQEEEEKDYQGIQCQQDWCGNCNSNGPCVRFDVWYRFACLYCIISYIVCVCTFRQPT